MFDIPFLDLPPLTQVGGRVALPGSKSISNRVLLLAALSEGRTDLGGLLDSDDTRVMLAALRALGCRVEHLADGRTALYGLGVAAAVAPGPDAPRWANQATLFLGNAGTAMRPLTAALAVLAAQHGGRYELSGVPRMHERPIADLVDALRALGCRIDDLGTPGYPPLRVNGPAALALDAPVRVRGDVSSQFLTALLLALPLAAAQRAIRIEVIGELISKPYIDISLNLLQRFGIAVQREGYAAFVIPAGSRYRSPGRLWVEADASSASYFIAAGAIAATREPLRIEGVGLDSIQGDIRFVEAARAMGADVRGGDGWLEVRRGAWPLRALRLDAIAIPDAAMTIAAMALYADGACRIDGIASWRVKETDRIAAMACELRRVGARVVEGPDFIEVEPPLRWRHAAFRTYDDHRMAMCLSLAAFHPVAAAGLAALPMRILEPSCVGKTFPDYFETLLDVARAEPSHIPVIAIDGPTASGKGTLAAAVAQRLGWHQLDSGALYRATALAVLQQGLDPADADVVAGVAAALPLRFEGDRVWLAGADVSADLRREDVGVTASKVAAHGPVRLALHALQLSFRRAPGLVADGRDMGTVVFPDAPLKVFLTASAATRAERRHKQLISKGIPATLADLRADLEARDERDRNRAVAPLKPAEDAQQLDNSALDIDQSVEQVLAWWAQRRPFD